MDDFNKILKERRNALMNTDIIAKNGGFSYESLVKCMKMRAALIQNGFMPA